MPRGNVEFRSTRGCRGSPEESDILIQAYSQPEGLTTVTLEGLATGLLIVTTPLSGGEDLNGCINYISGKGFTLSFFSFLFKRINIDTS